ncbi:helix-turn-helix transcriptional regulator [Bacillus sp. RO3]|nr:helix-turn-helix transcriptional regulator [Bacillus sp. RO3]
MGNLIYVLDDSIKQLNINANQLSKYSGVRHSTIYDILNNKADRPPRDTLEKILDAMNEIALEKELNIEFDINNIYKYIK